MMTIAYIALAGLVGILAFVVLCAIAAFGIDRANKAIHKDREQ